MYVLGPLYELFAITDPNAPKPFPYRMKFPYDANHGLSYAITYFITSLAGLGVVNTLLSEDSLFAFFITYTCGQFRMIHKSIDNLIYMGQERVKQRHRNTMMLHSVDVQKVYIQHEYHALLVKIIKHHNIVIR